MFTVPAGKYYLGDPCYTLGGDGWVELLEECKFFETPLVRGKKMAIAFDTDGDGQWDDQFGNIYPVDAGMIGLVPVSIATRKKPQGVTLVEFKTPVDCKKDGSILKFGQYEINLDPEEEEECCGECGRPY